jgi:uncharacterized protein YuzE
MDSTYDATHNLAYLSLTNESESDKVKRNVTLLDTDANHDIALNFDADDRLIGIKFLNASQSLRPEVLSTFRPIG